MPFKTPYYTVIFTNRLKELDADQKKHYDILSDRMVELATKEDGYLGIDSVRDDTRAGITISYWSSLESIRKWKSNTEHTFARNKRDTFYQHYQVKIALVEREYEFSLS